MHQIAPFKKKILGGACPRNPLAKHMASPCAACRFTTCKFPILKNKIFAPPCQILATPLRPSYMLLGFEIGGGGILYVSYPPYVWTYFFLNVVEF